MKIINLKNKLNKIITVENLFIIYLAIQPIFDLKIFYNSISTFIRIILATAFFMHYFIKNKSNKKFLILIYPIILGIYFIIHDWNCRVNFKSLVDGNFNYSTLKEILYIIKMITPYLLIYCLFKAKIRKNQIFNIMKVWVLFIGLIIIFTNILNISYCTYGDGIIKNNFFSWFNNKTYSYKELCSKGWFEYGNQISAILIMTLSIIIVECIEKKYKENIFILFINIFSLMLIGTKVAVFGTAICFICSIVINVIYNKQQIKNNIINCLLIILCICFYGICLQVNPAFSRIEESVQVVQENVQIVQENIQQEEQNNENIVIENQEFVEEDKYEYVKNNYEKRKINKNFIENRYSYICDVDFWYDLLKSNNPNIHEYRFLEKSMVKRVIDINSNKLDLFFGISYIRIQNIFNIEQDFVMQYYSLGIIGTILILFPYFVILMIGIYKFLQKGLKEINITNAIALITIVFLFGIAYYSGNLLNSLSFSIFLSVIYKLIIEYKEGEKNEE